MDNKMKKYNKFGANHRNVRRFEVENILHQDKNAAAFRIYDTKDEFHLYFLPNYENKTVEVSTDVNTKFSDAVVEFLVNNGDITNILEAVYTKAFVNAGKHSSPTKTDSKQVALKLPTFNSFKFDDLNLVS
jgi:hypothetical protein